MAPAPGQTWLRPRWLGWLVSPLVDIDQPADHIISSQLPPHTHKITTKEGWQGYIQGYNIGMKFEQSNGHTKDWADVNHNAKKTLPGRMSYITVTENAIKWWVTVNGLNHHEVGPIRYLDFHPSAKIFFYRPDCSRRKFPTNPSLMTIKKKLLSSVFLPGRLRLFDHAKDIFYTTIEI